MILERNFRCRRGEIDIIARDGETLVFAEVRLRTRNDFGGAAASIGARKRARMTAAALYYLGRRSRMPPCRFDALLLDSLDIDRIEWLKDIIGCEPRRGIVATNAAPQARTDRVRVGFANVVHRSVSHGS